MDKQEPEFSEPEFSGPEFSEEEGPASEAGIWERLEANRAEERRLLEAIVRENLKEQRKSRRGRNWFRLFIAVYLVVLLWAGSMDSRSSKDLKGLASGTAHTAVVDIRGPIMPGSTFSADNVIKGLTNAFEDPDTQGVILRINSPGGSPVQAGQIYDELERLKERFPNMPFYAALEDLCASGGYYVASAAPKIYADKATMVGSIGVIIQGFGFQETLNKLGVESRTLTAGKNKAFLDPFGPVDPKQREHARGLLKKIHHQFITAVKNGRGKRLKSWKADLFEGLVWTGEEAVELGLVDGLGSASWIARTLIKTDRLVEFTHESDWVKRLSKRFGVALMETFSMTGATWILR